MIRADKSTARFTCSDPILPYFYAVKHVSVYLLLLIIVFAGDRLGGFALQKQTYSSRFRYSRLYGGRAAADILLVGNSRGLTFYQPYIEEITGKTSFNLSYNGMPADLAKVLTEDYLDRYRAPQKMVVDITTCDRANDELIAAFLPYSGRSYRLDTLIHNKLPKAWWGGKVSCLFRFNNEIFQRALYYRHKPDTDWLLDRVIPADLAAAMQQHGYDVFDKHKHDYLIGQLRELVDFARRKNVPVELVIGPYFPGFAANVKNLDVLKKAVEQETGLTVRDYRNALSDPACFGDFMHPNKKGAVAYIDLLKRDGVLESAGND